MAKNRPAFVEKDQLETETTKRTSRITLPLGDDGRIAWDQVSDKKRVAFVEAVVNDDHTLSALSLKKDIPPGPLTITPEHVAMALDAYAAAERYVIPQLIKRQTKGIVVLGPEITSAAFVFTDEQKRQMGQPGAEYANLIFPEWLKEWLLKIGPGAQFFGLLALNTMAQTKTAVDMWKAQRRGPSAEATATDAPPPQPVNGKHVEPEIVPDAVIAEEGKE